MKQGLSPLASSPNSKPSPDEGLVEVGGFLVRALAGLAPGGGTLAEIMSLVIGKPSEKRRDAFVNELASKIDELVAKEHLSLEHLIGDEEASALFLQATQAAMRSEGLRKLTALRNAAINGATKRREERTTAFIALGVIERLSDLHLLALRCFREKLPSRPAPNRIAAFKAILASLPEIGEEDRTATASLIMYDLIGLGLIREGMRLLAKEISDLSENPDENGEDTLALTIVGSTVLDYIEEPNRS